MLDSILLGVGGLLAAAAILTEPLMLTRLMIALSFGVLVALYFWTVLPHYAERSRFEDGDTPSLDSHSS